MANGNTSPSRLGQINGGGAVDALFLKVFSGEILTTFEETNIMKNLHRVRTIQSGKTAQFPATGIATAKYHTVGDNIADSGNQYLSAIKHAEKTISIDDVLISSTFIANIDELKNHYDIRSIYAKELGKALAKRFDIATMKTLAAAARSSATITGGNDGTIIGSSSSVFSATPTAGEIIDALYLMAENLDLKDAPDDGRFAILTPGMYYTLLTSDNVAINRDTAGANGNVATGNVAQVAGISLYKSNHLVDVAVDSSSVSTGDGSSAVANDPFGTGTGYNADLSAVKVLGGTSDAIGTVKLLDLATESEYQIERQGTLFVAKYAMGHGVLRPECAVEIKLT